MTYLEQLEAENEELRQLLAAEQYNLKGKVTLTWTNWHMRYDNKNIFMYYQTVLTSYNRNFAFARIYSKSENPYEYEELIATIFKWGCEESTVYTKQNHVFYDTIKIQTEDAVKFSLFSEMEINIE